MPAPGPRPPIASPQKRWLAVVGLALLAALACRGLFVGGYYAFLYSQDFQWSPAVLLLHGRDAYAWYLSGNADDRIILSQEPNYLHLLYVLLLPLAALPWTLAKVVWGLGNAGMGAACGMLLASEAGLRGLTAWAALATFLAASPFAHTLGNGQMSLFVLFAMTLAWRARTRAQGGAAFAVGATKYSFAPPMFFWLLLEGRVCALGHAALIGVAGVAVYAGLSGDYSPALPFEPLLVSARATHRGLADLISFARAAGLDERFGAPCVYVAGLSACALGVAFLWRRRRELDDFTVFALLCQLSLFTLFHQLYDYVLLAPLFCRALTFSGGLRIVTLGYVGFFWFGVQFFDALPIMKTPAAIAAMALASAAAFVVVAAQRSLRARPMPATSAPAL